jgi:hypothetical protein
MNSRTNAVAICAQDANLLFICKREKLLNLLDLVGLAVILLGDRRVGLGVDLAGFELFRHAESCGNREISWIVERFECGCRSDQARCMKGS